MLTATDRKFVRDYLNADLHRLLLSAKRYPGVAVQACVAQIEALRKVREKIPAWFLFDLDMPPLLSVEQASSEAAARFKSTLFSGKKMADLTGGMGVDAYFFAQQFEQVAYVERNPELVALAHHNFAALDAANVRVEETDAETFLKTGADRYDLLYLDPARRADRHRRVFQLADCEPNVPVLREMLLARADRVLVKAAPLLDLSQAVEQLGAVSAVWVVSVGNEVKEVLYLLEKSAPAPDQIPIEAVCLGAEQQTFRFTRAAERAAEPGYALPQGYLYEPDAAVLKAGAFKSFALRFGLAKLHPQTHLYTSPTLVPDVPGRTFAIAALVKYERKALQEVLPDLRANVAARNFPDSPDAVRRKLGLADGGEYFVFGVTDAEGRKVLVVGRR
ncbi:MAG: hypothetical protein JNJ90_18915 [Saprospiraceae bacterium]|jgi:hypothetical protein|nr:hypothetical protein [Saprospiraceae bacterium]